MVSSRTLVLKATSRGMVRRCIDVSLGCGVAPNISAELDRDRSQQHGQMLGKRLIASAVRKLNGQSGAGNLFAFAGVIFAFAHPTAMDQGPPPVIRRAPRW